MISKELTSTHETAPPPAVAKQTIGKRLRDFSQSGQLTTCLLFLPPALLLFTIFVTFPVVEAAYYGFYNWNGYGPPTKWVNLQNYVRALSDPIFHNALFNNLLVILVSAFIQVPLALSVALLISDRQRSSVFFRAVFFLPYILGEVAAGLIWRYMYDGNYGVVAVIYSWFGLEAPQVLAEKGWAMAALLVVVIWKYFGFHMALFVAGRQGISSEILEAAQIDGASRWQIHPARRAPDDEARHCPFAVLQHFGLAAVLRHDHPANGWWPVEFDPLGGVLLVHVWNQAHEGRLRQRRRCYSLRHLRAGDDFLQAVIHARI